MTTTVKVHVNGRYRATVVHTAADGQKQPSVVVEGNYDGSPNPSGEHSFHLFHPASGTFEITEEAVPEDQPAASTAAGT
jgi:hypothetical protein